MMSDQRFDIRDKNKFKKDIKRSAYVEAHIALRIGYLIKTQHGYWPAIVPIGCDHTGEFLNARKVTKDPDYFIDGSMMELTRSDMDCHGKFSQKVEKVEFCIKNAYNIIFVNGFSEYKEPYFTIMKAECLRELTIRSYDKYGIIKFPGMGYCPCYRYSNSWFEWKILPSISGVELPVDYQQIITEIQNA